MAVKRKRRKATKPKAKRRKNPAPKAKRRKRHVKRHHCKVVNPRKTMAKRRTRKKARRRRKHNPGQPVLVVNPRKRRRRRRRKNPATVAANPRRRRRRVHARRRHHTRRHNPRRRRGHFRRRRNPGFGHVAVQIVLALGGGLGGLVAARLTEKASLSPLAMGLVELGEAVVGGGILSMFSPAAGAGFAGGSGLSGASKIFDALTVPSAGKTAGGGGAPHALNAAITQRLAQAQGAGVSGLGDLEAVEMAAVEIGAVEMGDYG